MMPQIAMTFNVFVSPPYPRFVVTLFSFFHLARLWVRDGALAGAFDEPVGKWRRGGGEAEGKGEGGGLEEQGLEEASQEEPLVKPFVPSGCIGASKHVGAVAPLEKGIDKGRREEGSGHGHGLAIASERGDQFGAIAEHEHVALDRALAAEGDIGDDDVIGQPFGAVKLGGKRGVVALDHGPERFDVATAAHPCRVRGEEADVGSLALDTVEAAVAAVEAV